MVARRLLLLLMMMATGAVAESPTRITDGELAKVVVDKTSKFLEGPTGRALSIQDRFQGWMNSLEQQISELTYNAVNRATSAISQIPFFETYFSQYQSPLPTLKREPPKEPPVLYIYPQSQQYLYHEDDQPSVHGAIGKSASQYLQQVEQNILNPDTVDDYQDNEDETSWYPLEISQSLPPHSQPPYEQAPEEYLPTREHYLKSLDSSPHTRDYPNAQEPNPHTQKPYWQAQEPNPHTLEHYPQSQEQYPQSQVQYLLAQQKSQKSVQLQDFSPNFQNPSVQKLEVSSGEQTPYVPLPPFVPESPQVFANGQVNEGSVNKAIRRVFTEDGGDSSSVQRQVSPIELPNTSGDGSYREGPYYPDPVAPKSPLRSNNEGISSTKPTVTQNLQNVSPDPYSPTQPLFENNNLPLPSYRPTPRHIYLTEDLVNAESSGVNATENLVPSAGLSRHGRSAEESFSIWNVFTDNTTPTALYCPSGGVKLLLCAGDQLFDAYVKAPIESAKDWVSNIDLHFYDH